MENQYSPIATPNPSTINAIPMMIATYTGPNNAKNPNTTVIIPRIRFNAAIPL